MMQILTSGLVLKQGYGQEMATHSLDKLLELSQNCFSRIRDSCELYEAQK